MVYGFFNPVPVNGIKVFDGQPLDFHAARATAEVNSVYQPCLKSAVPAARMSGSDTETMRPLVSFTAALICFILGGLPMAIPGANELPECTGWPKSKGAQTSV